ncbi:MAG: hypothetical protein QE271_04190 [Bacteriovoracaceae bacterium]|nr:hypothetical protein [Bacteriovoracaceae bacterium]
MKHQKSTHQSALRLLGVKTTINQWPIDLLRVDNLISQIGEMRLGSASLYFWSNFSHLFVMRSVHMISPLSEYERNTLGHGLNFFDCKIHDKLITKSGYFLEQWKDFQTSELWEFPRESEYFFEQEMRGFEIDEIKRIEHIY